MSQNWIICQLFFLLCHQFATVLLLFYNTYVRWLTEFEAPFSLFKGMIWATQSSLCTIFFRMARRKLVKQYLETIWWIWLSQITSTSKVQSLLCQYFLANSNNKNNYFSWFFFFFFCVCDQCNFHAILPVLFFYLALKNQAIMITIIIRIINY